MAAMGEVHVDDDYISGMVKENTVWDVYNNEAKKVDTELVKDWKDSLNFLLVFAAIFAAVLTAFIIESKKLLEQDPTDLLVDVVILYLSSGGNYSAIPAERPQFEASSTAVSINCLLFASLGASLIAALASVVALQWVNEYDAAITRGGSSPEDRAMRRQFRFAGTNSWKMAEIIAALPLLLYSSVLLFWIGAIMWIWSINNVVGYVVAGGAIIALLFYSSTTLISAIFVSAPFRTPISRGIYWLFQPILSSITQFLFGIIHRYTPKPLSTFSKGAASSLQVLRKAIRRKSSLLRLDHLASVLAAHFLPRRTTMQREDQAAAGHSSLKEQALCWLATQLPVSADSHARVAMMVREVLSHSSSQPVPPRFPSVPWAIILDTLAWPYMRKVLSGTLLESEYEGLVVLLRCARLPAMWRRLNRVEGYEKNPRRYTYWDQHRLEKADLGAIETKKPSNMAFLLARDVPIPTSDSTLEIEATINLIKWRNLRGHRGISAWEQLFENIHQFSPEYRQSCLDSYRQVVGCWLSIPKEIEGGPKVHDKIFANLAQQALTQTLPEGEVFGLAQAFEAWVTRSPSGFPDGFSPNSIIRRPLLYGLALWDKNERKNIHWDIALCIARAIKSRSDTGREKWAWSITMMIWIGYADINWDRLIKRHGENVGMNDLWPSVAMNWRKDTYKIPHIGEILRIIDGILPHKQHIRPIWLFGTEEDKRDQVVKAVESFDNLIAHDNAPDLHLSLVRILSIELQHLAQHWSGSSTSQEDRAERLSYIRDPCLAVTGAYICKVSAPIESTMSEVYIKKHSHALGIVKVLVYQGPWLNNAETIWKFRARVWSLDSAFPMRKLLTSSMHQLEQLSFLESIFQYPVSCYGHSDGPHHILFHLFEAFPPSIQFPDGTLLLEKVSLTREAFNPILVLLSLSSGRNPSSLAAEASFNPECIQVVRRIIQAIKQEPAYLVALLTDIILVHGDRICRPKQAAFIVESTRQLLPLEEVEGSTSMLHRLALALRGLTAEMVQKKRGTDEDRDIVAAEAERLCGALETESSKRVVSSPSQLALLSCARASPSNQPATGWIGMHVTI